MARDRSVLSFRFYPSGSVLLRLRPRGSSAAHPAYDARLPVRGAPAAAIGERNQDALYKRKTALTAKSSWNLHASGTAQPGRIRGVKFPRFRGHPSICAAGVHNGKKERTLHAGVSASDDRAGWPQSRVPLAQL